MIARRYSRLYLNPDRNLAATPRILARAISSPHSASVMSISLRHHSTCCGTVGSGRAVPSSSILPMRVTRYGFPTPPRATMTAVAPVTSIASTASSGVQMSPDTISGIGRWPPRPAILEWSALPA